MYKFDKLVLFKIALELDIPDVFLLCLSSKTLNEKICLNQMFWMQKLNRDFNVKIIPDKYKLNNSFDYKKYYLHIENLVKTYPIANKLLIIGSTSDLNIVKIAKNKKADIHITNNLPLRLASGTGHLDIVKFLVNSGADISVFSQDPINVASKNNHLDVVKYLITKGAEVTNGIALMNASYEGHIDIVKYLSSLITNIDLYNESLSWAIREGHLNVVKFLLSKGANIHQEGDYNLVEASESGHLDIVRYLVKNGLDVDAHQGLSLIYASENGYLYIVKYLIDEGANPHTMNDRALFLAIENGYTEIENILKRLF